MGNPYHYGTPVTGAQFAGREQELAAVTARMRDGINVVLVSPRRYGKTSLLGRAAESMRAEGAAVLTANVLRSRDAAAFAAHLATGAFALPGGTWHKVRQAVPEFLRRLRVTPSVTFDGDRPRFSLSPGLSPEDADTVISDVYALLGELADDKPAVLVLDEFQAVADLGAHLPALFKSLADDHPQVSLVLAGSKRHLMARLVSESGAPLYGLAEHFALEPIPADVMVSYLRRRARSGGKPMGADAARHLVALSGPVPNDIQHLAYEAFDVAEDRLDVGAVDRGLARAVAHEASLHADRFESMAAGQRRVVLELADHPTAEPYAADFARRVSLATAGSVRRALDALTADEVVVRRDGSYQVADPFFAAWLRHTG